MKCKYEECDNNVHREEWCILHSPKGSYQDDSHDGTLHAFYKSLAEHIAGLCKPIADSMFDSDISVITNYLIKQAEPERQDVASNLKKRLITITGVSFPQRDSRDFFDFQKMLNLFDSVQFVKCHFWGNSLSLNESRTLFMDCTFENKWFLTAANPILEIYDVLYDGCGFKHNVSTLGHDYPSIRYSVFANCKFSQSIEFEGVTVEGQIFNDKNESVVTIPKLSFINSDIKERIILRKKHIESLNFEDSNFHKKFELKYSKVANLKSFNTNFGDAFNVYKVDFGKCDIRMGIFNQYFGMEKCEFSNHSDNLDTLPTTFEYVTFNDIVNFRNSKFLTGLNLEHINTTRAHPTFLGATVADENTNRETFRRIKYSFDNMGNNLEGNEYYRKEMAKYHSEVKDSNSLQLKFLLGLYRLTSDYGQNIWRPIWLAMLSTGVFSLLSFLYSKGYYVSYDTGVGKIVQAFNFFASNMLPVSKILKEGMELISFLYYLSLMSFVWLTLLGVKRKTKR
jgi:hypothetical protein